MARFLLVDDNAQNLYLLRALLAGHGHEVTTAKNGREALDAARAWAPDAIVSDILMPEMDGFTLCRECKADAALAPVPFIFYTATYTEKKDEELALKLGGTLFIRKPAEPDEFMRLMDSVLGALPATPAPRSAPAERAEESLTLYNERLVQKLEKKMLDLEGEVAERARAERRLAEAQRIGGLEPRPEMAREGKSREFRIDG